MADNILQTSAVTNRVGLLIAFLAAVMVLTNMAGDNAQSDSVAKTVEASNLWAFFQAKTIRKTAVETAADEMELMAGESPEPEKSAAITAQIAKWRAAAAAFESEPAKGEGRRELMERARQVEAERDLLRQQNLIYDIATACLQIAILLASTALITGLLWLAYLAGGLGLAGAAAGLYGALGSVLG